MAVLTGQAWAATRTTVGGAVAGSEATNIEALIVTAERNTAAAAAPTKASLDAMQPQSIVSHGFIEAFTSENGDYSTVLQIAPSIGGISSNGGPPTISPGFKYANFTRTADADVCKIFVSDLEVAGPNGQYYVNAGPAH